MSVHKKITEYVKQWESQGYSEGIPDFAPNELEDLNLVPSYRRIALAILNNDIILTSLGFEPKKSEYYGILKRIELNAKTKAHN